MDEDENSNASGCLDNTAASSANSVWRASLISFKLCNDVQAASLFCILASLFCILASCNL